MAASDVSLTTCAPALDELTEHNKDPSVVIKQQPSSPSLSLDPSTSGSFLE